MKKKVLKIIGIIGLSFALLVGSACTYVYLKFPLQLLETKNFYMNNFLELDTTLSKDEVIEDINSIIDVMESTHPIFLKKVPEEYYIAKSNLMNRSNESMTVGELQNEISKYLSSIEDGHTTLYWKENEFLDIQWRYVDGSLYLLDDKMNLTDKVITKIDNIDIDTIISEIKETFSAENYVAEAKNIEQRSKGRLLLESVGIENKKDVIITLESKENIETLEYEFVNHVFGKIVDTGIYSNIIDEKIGYIRLGKCEVNKNLDIVLNNIEDYKKAGIKDYIIDVVDNGGGSSTASTLLLEALDMKFGNYGVEIRFSPLAQNQRGYVRKSGSTTIKGNNESKKNKDINLYILTNEHTFSSAQMLAVFVSDGKLGKIVGRPSINKPSSYGDVLSFQLNNSKLAGQISHKKWMRPDIGKDEYKVLEPDIYVEDGDNILDRAIEEINKQ